MAVHNTSGPYKVGNQFDIAAAAQGRAMKMAGKSGPGKSGRGGAPKTSHDRDDLISAKAKRFPPILSRGGTLTHRGVAVSAPTEGHDVAHGVPGAEHFNTGGVVTHDGKRLASPHGAPGGKPGMGAPKRTSGGVVTHDGTVAGHPTEGRTHDGLPAHNAGGVVTHGRTLRGALAKRALRTDRNAPVKNPQGVLTHDRTGSFAHR